MIIETRTTEMSKKQFDQIKHAVYDYAGIKLSDEKQKFVSSRLTKRLNALKFNSFKAYLSLIEKDSTEFLEMIDALTTNKTNFFRELPHFNFLKNEILPGLVERRLRIWSAACSSGEEPYSIAMLLCELLPDIHRWDVKILATDISFSVLEKAKAGVYSDEGLSGVPAAFREKYFVQTPEQTNQIIPGVRKLITYAPLNFMEDWPMKGPFDLILCRNVMIYFDKETQSNLVHRLYDLIDEGGYLFIGHSENLTNINHNFDYVQPATYIK